MRTTNLAEATTQLSELIEQALAGEEIIISEHGKPVVRLVPYEQDTRRRDMSVRIWEGHVRIADDFDELPQELMDMFTGKQDEPLT